MLLVLGMTGPQIGTLHQLLVEAGEFVDAGELRQAVFGPSTKTAILDFQSSHLDSTGRPLSVDGQVGPVTWAALEDPRAPHEVFLADGWRGDVVAAPNDDARAAVAVAIGEIGTKEDPPGSNRGPRVDMYEGADWLGSPWCALFASWCWGRAPGGSPFGVLASALKLRDWGTQHGALLGAEPLLPGDIGLILRARGRGHVEIVTSLEWDGQVALVGGNVSNAVRGTVRARGAFSHFLRPRRA